MGHCRSDTYETDSGTFLGEEYSQVNMYSIGNARASCSIIPMDLREELLGEDTIKSKSFMELRNKHAFQLDQENSNEFDNSQTIKLRDRENSTISIIGYNDFQYSHVTAYTDDVE
ncbi:Hypothetical_protein [Hexamita inflata]|uniref:Hypothetical_protein n=1 Tax=Hexamita inflata TaxID=28002 RepID=A0AA86P8F2_9EUKA|nr:Hypothetical protein HINF_LOCUS19809 [Hexamita inflata]